MSPSPATFLRGSGSLREARFEPGVSPGLAMANASSECSPNSSRVVYLSTSKPTHTQSLSIRGQAFNSQQAHTVNILRRHLCVVQIIPQQCQINRSKKSSKRLSKLPPAAEKFFSKFSLMALPVRLIYLLAIRGRCGLHLPRDLPAEQKINLARQTCNLRDDDESQSIIFAQ